MNKKIIGYISSGIGILLIVFSTPAARSMLGLATSTLGKTQMTIGLAAVVFGAVFLMNPSSRSSKQEEEVPIYEGHGKNRKIIGYRKLTEEDIKK